MFKGMHHTAISTPDLDRLVGFYCDLFDFKVTMDWKWDQGNANMDRTHALSDTSGRVVMIERDGARLELFQYRTPSPNPADPSRRNVDHGISHLCFEFEDIDAEYERLRQSGMRFHCEPADYGTAKCTYGRDPDGNLIEIIEYLDAGSA